VQQVEIDVVDPEPAQAGVEAPQRGVVAVIADPQLGGDEDVPAVDAGAADAVADLALVAVGGGCVDQPVALGERGLDGGDRLCGGLWYTPSPRAGIVTPLFSSRLGVVATAMVGCVPLVSGCCGRSVITAPARSGGRGSR
jgi:hypothetical protein